MKRTFVTFLSTLCAALAITGCVKEEQYVGPPTISDFTFSPSAVTPDDDVTVSVTVSDLNGLKSVDLYYSVNNAAEQSTAMTASGTTYSATIGKQAESVSVELWVVAVNNLDKSATTEKKSFTSTYEAGSQSDLRINQVGSVDGAKYICIYNTSSSPVNVAGMGIYKNNEGIWGEAFGDLQIPGKGYAVYRGKATEAEVFAGAVDLGQNANGGVSGKKSLLFELKDATGQTIDAFCNSSIEAPKVSDAWDGSVEYPFDVAGRVPDGTGSWYVLTNATLGGSNAAATQSNQLSHQVDITVAVEPTAPKIGTITATPSIVKPGDSVVVTAVITNDAQSSISSVTLKYKVNNGEFTSVSMAASTDPEEVNTYSAEIPAQADKAVVTYTIDAANSANLTSSSAEASYTVEADAPQYDFSGLVLNEVDGINKAVELFNSGTTEIDLAGCTIQKDGATIWTAASYTVAAGAYVVLYSSDVTGDTGAQAGYNTALVFNGGLSAKKAVKIELFDPSNTSLGVFDRQGSAFFEDKANSFSNFEGEWFYAPSSLGKVNGPSSGVIGAAKSALCFNEIDGNSKYIEFINTTSESINIEGYKMYKDDGETAVWVAPNGTTVAGGAMLTLLGDKNATADDYATKFIAGLSAKKSVKMALYDANNNLIDVFIRGKKGSAWGDQSLTENASNSFSRISADASWGSWGYATPTIGSANGESTGAIEVE